MSSRRHHADWLSLIEVSGPFLTMPVLERVFPQGLEAHDPEHVRSLRLAFEEWEDNQASEASNPAIHRAWIHFVLRQTLGLPAAVIVEGQAIPQTLKAMMAEHGETVRPDVVIRNPDGVPRAGKARLLIHVYPVECSLEKPIPGRHWKASPATRMMELLHAADVRLGLATNGEHWMLVDAPRGETTGFASWYATLWFEEPITLRAFRSLLGAGRFFSVPDNETLEAMLAESAMHQQEVTDQLGLQVRRSVEVLIQSLDRADQDQSGKLLRDVPETVLYEAALTVMMRLVFLFSAEERGLLLLGDPLYDQCYAVSTLVAQLQESADQLGEEVLERRFDAWSRLLSTFRVVYGGVQHERMRLLPYCGGLFDPDRVPFLEGREPDTTWRNTPATPLPIDNRTVLHLLRSLQYLEMQGEARRLSFRALDIEQIGHVYESLLDHTAVRAAEPVLGLAGAKSKEPEVPISRLERYRVAGEDDLVGFVCEETGRSESAVRRGLAPDPEAEGAAKLRAVCGNDATLYQTVRPYAALIREDTFDRPVVIREGSVYVTAGTDRRSSGTHYTPRSLTEPIVQYTLEPLVYQGPAEGKPKEEWTLRSAKELLDLKICDMACGSGAFLVQACRYLSERLMEAWEEAERAYPGVPGVTPEGAASTGEVGEMLIPKDPDERLAYARRIVAQRCLYGVDKNRLAVEMAKLSLWLLTLAKDKPFTFLDHAIRCGDSLMGITTLDQLARFDLKGERQEDRLFLRFLPERIREAMELRRRIGERPAEKPEDTAIQADLMRRAEEETERLRACADLLLAAEFRARRGRDDVLAGASMDASRHLLEKTPAELCQIARSALQGRPTFHWPLEFPEVIAGRSGFDALVCNPPFMGGQKITGHLGADYRDFLVEYLANGRRGSADLCAYFFLRAAGLLRQGGQFGFLATNTIAQGDTREVGLDQLFERCYSIPRAVPSRKWPGTASLEVAHVWVRRGAWQGPFVLDDQPAVGVTSYLTSPAEVTGRPYRLVDNAGKSFQGSNVLGLGFVVESDEVFRLIEKSSRSRDVLFPYLNGEDLNSRPDQSPSRWVINFFDWPLRREGRAGWASADEKRQQEWLRSGIVPRDYPGSVAADYPDCLAIVEERVKPDRDRLAGGDATARDRARRWWQFARPTMALYAAIARLERVLVLAQVSRTLAFVFVPNGWVYTHKTVVFPTDGLQVFGALQNSLHSAWAWEFSATLKRDLSYSPSDCFLTYPFPSGEDRALAAVSEVYHEHRRQVMLGRQEGLTRTYNRFHDPREESEDIRRLRALHVEMDNAVAAAYGWKNLELGHGFHQTRQGVRFTLSESARREVLQRLLKLNHESYAEEVQQGLHEKKAKGIGKSRSRKSSDSMKIRSLFGEEQETAVSGILGNETGLVWREE